MMGWKCYTKDSVSYAAMTDETQALDYRIEWAMNQPATLDVLVNDDSGAKTQTYGTGYLGTSALLIEQPTGTEIFRGRIVGVEPNPGDGVVKLVGEDWLSQLNDRLVIFDTRENLGNGIREYPAVGHKTAGTTCNAFRTEAGPVYRMRVESGPFGFWADNSFNNMRLVFPTKHLGTMTDTLWAYDENADSSAAPLTTDTPANGETYTWAKDTNYHALQDTLGVNGWMSVEYYFKSLAPSSTLVDSLDSLTVTVNYKVYGAGLSRFRLMVWNVGDWYETLVDSTSAAMTEFREATYTVGGDDLTEFFSLGALRVLFYVESTPGGVVNLDVNQIYCTLTYTVDTAHTERHTISDTGSGDPIEYNWVSVSDDIVTDGVVDYFPFSICDKVTEYVADLVGLYDELYALDATSDVTASTNYIGRHYHRQTPLQILRDLAQADGTQFYLDKWDGDSLDLHWNDAFGGAATATWTDASVLAWTPGGYRLKEIINEAFVEGLTAGDTKVQDDYSDPGSIGSYGQRSRYLQNADIARNDEALTEATNIVTRLKDPRLLLSSTLNGYSTVVLGNIITVNSAKYNINTDYVVVRKVYDSQSATSTFDLAPKTTMLTIRPPLSQVVTRLDDRIAALETTMERASRYSETWT